MENLKVFFKKVGALFIKVKAWAVAHSVAAISIAVGAVAAITLAVVLPVTLSNKKSKSNEPGETTPEGPSFDAFYAEVTGLNNYTLKIAENESYDDEMMGLDARVTDTYTCFEKAYNGYVVMDQGEDSNIMSTTVSYTGMVEVAGSETILLGMLESLKLDGTFDSYEIDKANDTVTVNVDQSDFSFNPDAIDYVELPTETKQGRLATFVRGKLRVDYDDPTPRYLTNDEEYTTNFAKVLKVMKDHKESLVEKDSVYTYSSETPFEVYGYDLNKISFGKSGSNYVITAEGQIERYGDPYDIKVVMEVSNVGSTQVDIPEFEVNCPFNHECVTPLYFNEEGHKLGCACCGKYIGEEVVPHVESEHFDGCLECSNLRELTSGKEYDIQYNVSGPYSKFFDLVENSKGDVVIQHTDLDFAKYEKNVAMTVNDLLCNCNLTYNDDVESVVAVIEVDTQPITIDEVTYCLEETKYELYIFNTKVTFSLEIQDKLNKHEITENEAFYMSLGSPESIEALCELFTQYSHVTAYGIEHCHAESIHVDHPTSCMTTSYKECVNCHYCYEEEWSVSVEHTREALVVNPEWGEEDWVYWTYSACSECGEPFDIVYGVEKIAISSMTKIYIFEDGEKVDYTWDGVPHIDMNEDGICDLCGHAM